jgi:hypothetical protein
MTAKNQLSGAEAMVRRETVDRCYLQHIDINAVSHDAAALVSANGMDRLLPLGS